MPGELFDSQLQLMFHFGTEIGYSLMTSDGIQSFSGDVTFPELTFPEKTFPGSAL